MKSFMCYTTVFLLFSVGAWFAAEKVTESHRESFTMLKKERDALERKLSQKKQERVELSRFVNSLKYERSAVEKVAREKFGLCYPGERIYKYK